MIITVTNFIVTNSSTHHFLSLLSLLTILLVLLFVLLLSILLYLFVIVSFFTIDMVIKSALLLLFPSLASLIS